MDMNILKYMAFIKTVDCGSFTRAAEILNYSQSERIIVLPSEYTVYSYIQIEQR